MVEQAAVRLTATVGYCLVCGHVTIFKAWQKNLRETGVCLFCRSKNRQRQIAYVLCMVVSEQRRLAVRRIADLYKLTAISIYNTEASGALHIALSRLPGYVSSEYFGPEYISGKFVNGVRHEDLTALSFPDNSFDIVLSSDVLEHIPDPYQAHREVWRVLRPGGRHIFTVPFHQTGYLDDVLAKRKRNGELQIVKEAIYHCDPLRPEGSLVYTIFSLEMLVRLNRIGFQTRIHRLYCPLLGILGPNGLVFEAIKTM